MLQATSKHVDIGQIPPGKKYRYYIFIKQSLLLEKGSAKDSQMGTFIVSLQAKHLCRCCSLLLGLEAQ